MLDIAERDADSSEKLLADSPILETAAYLVQQAAEKHVKAALTSMGIAYPKDPRKGHDIKVLANLIPASSPLKGPASKLSTVTPWATEFRYPEAPGQGSDLPSTTDLRNHLNEIRAFGRLVLGSLPSPVSTFVAKLTAASKRPTMVRNRIDILLDPNEIKSFALGSPTFDGFEAAIAIKPYVAVEETLKTGRKVLKTGKTLRGQDGLEHLCRITEQASAKRRIRVPFNAAAVDEVASAASGDLAKSFTDLANLASAREGRWPSRNAPKAKARAQRSSTAPRRP